MKPRQKSKPRTAPPKPRRPDLIAIANKLRSVALVLGSSTASTGGPLQVVRGIVAEIDEWEARQIDG